MNKKYIVDENEQADYVIEQILAHRETGVTLKQQAVLFRASHHSLALELELSRRNIPFHKFGGLKFVEAAHVKDLLAFLRLAENPRDSVSALRILLLLPGIGPKKASQLVEVHVSHRSDFNAWTDFKPPAASSTPTGRCSCRCSRCSPSGTRSHWNCRWKSITSARSTRRSWRKSLTTPSREYATSSRSNGWLLGSSPAHSS